jgi:hypothetical protein
VVRATDADELELDAVLAVKDDALGQRGPIQSSVQKDA